MPLAAVVGVKLGEVGFVDGNVRECHGRMEVDEDGEEWKEASDICPHGVPPFSLNKLIPIRHERRLSQLRTQLHIKGRCSQCYVLTPAGTQAEKDGEESQISRRKVSTM
ncbi:hypothetical protein M434DRAFT_30012 [Hypoxylon sp. CO27-5]|nr:hypothetical protein M434DRAFT_30012 [Hypoxylon sp. CO27-5]